MATKYCPNVFTTPLRQWGFRQCLPFSWTTLRDKHCRHPIAVMGVVDMFGLDLFWFVLTHSDQLKFVLICSDLFRSVLICSDMFQFILIHSDPFQSNRSLIPYQFQSVSLCSNPFWSTRICFDPFRLFPILSDMLWSVMISHCTLLCTVLWISR